MSVSIVFDVSSDAGLAQLNAFMASRSYLVGYSLTQSDVALVSALEKEPDASKYPHLARYYKHIQAVKGGASSAPAGVTVVSGAASGAGVGSGKSAAAAAEEDDDEDDDDDLFGDDSDDDGAMLAAAKKAEEAASKKKKKVRPAAKTQVLYEVKPAEIPADMAALEAFVRSISLDGLTWGEKFEIEEVGYGIQKLIVQCVVIDDKVDLADLEEALEANEDVGSIDQLTMQKL